MAMLLKSADENIPKSKLLLDNACSAIDKIILGKKERVRLSVACLLAGGHLLIEDVPGVGKTTLAQTLAIVLGLKFKRIQFTSDLMPADILGVSIYRAQQEKFDFHPGPIFSNLVLADEINRATPKTQSALLEAMAERQISSDGVTYRLPEPFFVIATQNPQHLIGTFSLPESQLDRFLMRIDMGYPDEKAEQRLLSGKDRKELLTEQKPVLTEKQILALQKAVATVHCSDALLNYVQAILMASRQSSSFTNGLSPRAGIAVVKASKSWAFLDGRNMVLPEDVQQIAPHVIAHRLQSTSNAAPIDKALAEQFLESISIP